MEPGELILKLLEDIYKQYHNSDNNYVIDRDTMAVIANIYDNMKYFDLY